ncbi:putative uncharacterized protein C7orf78 [Watersipora subatra]|uniref:putative uncharacterized protein C7orf78 n=1 Tax=Watersipora subatra TaxID=2589382 RepID=UPI00355C750E
MEELEKTFDFGKRNSYNATKSLARIRSSKYKRVKAPVRYDLWNRPAPDLRMQLYHPHPVPRNSQEAIQPWKFRASFDSEKPVQLSKSKVLPQSIQDALFGGEEKETKMTISPRVLRPHEAKILFVKKGILPKEVYSNPKPHDHRALPSLKSLGLPEFTSSYEKDPYNIMFKSKNLDQVHGLPVNVRDVAPGPQMGDNVLRQPPKFEKSLHLPHPSFPTRMMNTTRHRPLYRSPHSAYLERVETKLSKEWRKERAVIATAPAKAHVSL